MATSATIAREMIPDHPIVSDILGRFVAASNATLLGTLDDGVKVVYKPIAGEAPLWDFPPDTLAVREVLTYRLSALMGFDVVPHTVMGDGLYGPGSVQEYIDIDDGFDALDLVRASHDSLWPIAIIDAVANNADRKVGHILGTRSGGLVAIDHGLTFHHEEKLRTVLWGFAGRSVDPLWRQSIAVALDAARGSLGDEVEELLGSSERLALVGRCEALLETGVHPHPPEDRPAVPWPPY